MNVRHFFFSIEHITNNLGAKKDRNKTFITNAERFAIESLAKSIRTKAKEYPLFCTHS